MKSVIYFDIDRTLVDSMKIRELTRGGMCRELNLNRDQVNTIIHEYTGSLKHKNNFCREDMLELISQRTGIKYDLIKNAHDRAEYYEKSLFDDVIISLEKLKNKGYSLGIYSEGFIDYQMDKLKLSGIYNYFDSDKIIISRKKLTPENVDRLGESIVVDDWVEVIDYLSNYPQLSPIWLNRIDDKSHNKVRTIFSLSEIVI